MYVDNMKDKSKLTSLIHGHVHSSDAYKVLGDFVTKYYRGRTTKVHRREPATNIVLEDIKRTMLSYNMQLMRSSCKTDKN